MKNRIWQYDFLKFVMSILVVLLHVASYQRYADYSAYLPNMIDSLGRVAVPVFFMISGINLFRKKKNTNRHYRLMISRVIVPTITVTVLFVIYRCFIVHEELNVVIQQTLQVGGYYHLPFMYRLLALYCIAPIFQYAWDRIEKGSLLIFAAFAMLSDQLINRGYNLFWISGLYPVGYAVMGALIATVFEEKKYSIVKKGYIKAGILFLAYILCSAVLCRLTMDLSIKSQTLNEKLLSYENPLIVVASICLLLSIMFLPIDSINERIGSMIWKLSRVSFGVYLIHPLIIDLFVSRRLGCTILSFHEHLTDYKTGFIYVAIGVYILSAVIVSVHNYVYVIAKERIKEKLLCRKHPLNRDIQMMK